MKLTFLGADQSVTGSKHLVEANGRKILLDCGSVQGHRETAYQANSVLPPETANLDAVILSHAHADHCGSLPLLVKNGFNKNIYATPATIDIASLIMLDAAKIQENDFENLKKTAAPGKKIWPPIYSDDDVEKTSRLFAAVPYSQDFPEWHNLGPDLDFKFYNAGHILGSAITLIKSGQGENTVTLAYTGDLGNTNVPILPDPEIITEPVQALISECTYGDRNHRPIKEAIDFLKEVINDAVARQSRIIVPAFALGRTQELIYILHKLHDDGQIPAIPIYLDSPLANEITAVFSKHKADFDQETWQNFINNDKSPFAFEKLNYIKTATESKMLAQKLGPLIIIASSGMLEGGRVLHHLENNIGNPESVILLTGYQAENTLGRKLQDGNKQVNIYNRPYEVRAKILSLDEFSAHADQTGLLNYILALKGLKKLFLVHTEPEPARILAQLVQKQRPDLKIIIPVLGESFEI
jgi:metallo-beta-lactamase family protein